WCQPWRDRYSVGRLHVLAISRRISTEHSHRRHLVSAARSARADRGAHGMTRFAALAVVMAAAVAIAVPFFLKPFGIFLISIWAVLTIAAIGLNLTLGYAGQISL